jgi:hypothetical protein
MFKRSGIIITIFISLLFVSCNKDTTKKDEKTDKQTVTDTTKKNTPSADNTEILAKLKKYREEGEQKLNDKKFTKKEVNFSGDGFREDLKQKWERMDAYFEGDKVVRIQLYPHKGVSERTEEFYIMDGKLIFVFIQDKGPKHEGADMGEPGKEMFFYNDKLISYEDRSGEKTNIETDKKLYETKMPVEAKELLEILKTVK